MSKRIIEEKLTDAELLIISGALSVICEMDSKKVFKELEEKCTRIAIQNIKASYKLSQENTKMSEEEIQELDIELRNDKIREYTNEYDDARRMIGI